MNPNTPQGMTPTEMAKVQSAIRSALPSATTVLCDKCNNATFEPAVLVKKISQLMSPTSSELVIPIEVLSCKACGWVNEMFLQQVGLAKQTTSPIVQSEIGEVEPTRPKLSLI